MEEIAAIFADMGFVIAEGRILNRTIIILPPSISRPNIRPVKNMILLPECRCGWQPSGPAYPYLARAGAHHAETAPPIRIIVPGRTYRSDHDATHSPMFHQCEGLVIGPDIHMGHLKAVLIDFCRAFFGMEDLPVRFRPSYFPFTEPSAEVDIGCSRAGGGLQIGAGEDWLEILGSGMVNPRVLANCGYDPDKVQGFAFGMGIERLAMLKYGIPDLRTFYDSDLRWLRHYGFVPSDMPALHSGLV